MRDDAEFWTRWQAHYATLGVGGAYCKDGAGSLYEVTTPRVLFILKEPTVAGQDMRSQLDKGPEHQVWHAVGRWAAGLLHGFPDYGTLREATLMESMKRVAAINAKKATGPMQSDTGTVNAWAYRDRGLLREQIDRLRPDVIVACGTFHSALWVVSGSWSPVFGNEGPLGARSHTGTIMMAWRHPTRAGRKHYDELRVTYERLRTATIG